MGWTFWVRRSVSNEPVDAKVRIEVEKKAAGEAYCQMKLLTGPTSLQRSVGLEIGSVPV